LFRFTAGYHLLFKTYQPPMEASSILKAIILINAISPKKLRFYTIHHTRLSINISHRLTKIVRFRAHELQE